MSSLNQVTSGQPPTSSVNLDHLSSSRPERIAVPILNDTPSVDLRRRAISIETHPLQSLKRSESCTSELKIFESIHSNECVPLNGIITREDFKRAAQNIPSYAKPVVISQSEFVPKQITEHLMRNKKDSALGVKYKMGDKITMMEGALHTFITPICPITMSGDYTYQDGHLILPLKGQGRNVVLSASVQPDFEKSFENEVVMRIVEVTEEPLEGKSISDNFQPLWSRVAGDITQFQRQLKEYDEQLQKHMVYHLTSKSRLPGLKEVNKIQDPKQTLEHLEQLIQSSDKNLDERASLVNRFVEVNEHVISLEALFSIYIHQVRNEFSALETLLPQGYVYTIDPPSIFAKQIGLSNVKLLNRLQVLAFKYLRKGSSFSNLKAMGFNDYADKEAVELFKIVFSDKIVSSKQDFFRDGGYYSVKDPYALVVHNNSDAFGQNIETEDLSSMDGVIGSYSDGSYHLQRHRKDLLKYIF